MKKGTAFRCSVLVGAALACATPALAQTGSTPAGKMDIAGVRIGMTEAEVVKAIKAFDAGAQVRRRMASYSYFDGVNSLDTPEFLSRLETTNVVTAFFSGPPSEPRVYAVTRAGALDQPPTGEQFLSALVAKYGPVGAQSLPGSVGPRMVQWNEQGKPTCTVVKDQSGRLVPDSSNKGTLIPEIAAKLLEQHARQKFPGMVLSMGSSIDAARCGTVLRYEWLGEPVRNFEARLIDQGALIATNRQSMEWVKQLEAEAVRKRQARGAAPKL